MGAPPPGTPTPPTSGDPGPESEPQHAVTPVRRRRRRRPRWSVLLVALVVLGLVGYLAFTRFDVAEPDAVPLPAPVSPTPAPPPSSTSPGPPPPSSTAVAQPRGSVPPPTPARPPTTKEPSSAVPSPRSSRTPRPQIRTGLTDNTLYSVALEPGSGVCDAKIRRPEPPVPDKELVGYLETLVGCLDEALTPALRTAGFTLTEPAVKGYRQQISTPCGWLNPTSAPAYYCSGDNVVYVPFSGDDGDEAYTYARLGYLALIAHEHGHHLQYVSGMFGDYTSRYYKAKLTDRYALSRRLELQADCFAGVFLAHVADSIDLDADDRAQLREWHGYTGDDSAAGDRPPDHGTSAAQRRWLDRGLDSADYGRCNTWKAPVDAVR